MNHRSQRSAEERHGRSQLARRIMEQLFCAAASSTGPVPAANRAAAARRAKCTIRSISPSTIAANERCCTSLVPYTLRYASGSPTVDGSTKSSRRCTNNNWSICPGRNKRCSRDSRSIPANVRIVLYDDPFLSLCGPSPIIRGSSISFVAIPYIDPALSIRSVCRPISGPSAGS